MTNFNQHPFEAVNCQFFFTDFLRASFIFAFSRWSQTESESACTLRWSWTSGRQGRKLVSFFSLSLFYIKLNSSISHAACIISSCALQAMYTINYQIGWLRFLCKLTAVKSWKSTIKKSLAEISILSCWTCIRNSFISWL